MATITSSFKAHYEPLYGSYSFYGGKFSREVYRQLTKDELKSLWMNSQGQHCGNPDCMTCYQYSIEQGPKNLLEKLIKLRDGTWAAQEEKVVKAYDVSKEMQEIIDRMSSPDIISINEHIEFLKSKVKPDDKRPTKSRVLAMVDLQQKYFTGSEAIVGAGAVIPIVRKLAQVDPCLYTMYVTFREVPETGNPETRTDPELKFHKSLGNLGIINAEYTPDSVGNAQDPYTGTAPYSGADSIDVVGLPFEHALDVAMHFRRYSSKAINILTAGCRIKDVNRAKRQILAAGTTVQYI